MLIPGSGRCPGGGHDNPLQYSFPGNPMNRGGRQATVRHDLETKQQQCVEKQTWSVVLFLCKLHH